jgi:hypothetical protein
MLTKVIIVKTRIYGEVKKEKEGKKRKMKTQMEAYEQAVYRKKFKWTRNQLEEPELKINKRNQRDKNLTYQIGNGKALWLTVLAEVVGR